MKLQDREYLFIGGPLDKKRVRVKGSPVFVPSPPPKPRLFGLLKDETMTIGRYDYNGQVFTWRGWE